MQSSAVLVQMPVERGGADDRDATDQGQLGRAKSPILIATLDEFCERAGSVVVVSRVIVTGGVQDADIEPARSGSLDKDGHNPGHSRTK